MPKSSRDRSTPQGQRLRNTDYADRELLGIISDEAGADGWASSEDIARRLGFTTSSNGSKASPASRVVPRLTWMKRFGLITRQVDSGTAQWSLTEDGKQLLDGKLSKSVEGALGRMGPGDQLLTMRALTRREERETIRIALRREYLHNAAR